MAFGIDRTCLKCKKYGAAFHHVRAKFCRDCIQEAGPGHRLCTSCIKALPLSEYHPSLRDVRCRECLKTMYPKDKKGKRIPVGTTRSASEDELIRALPSKDGFCPRCKNVLYDGLDGKSCRNCGWTDYSDTKYIGVRITSNSHFTEAGLSGASTRGL